MKTTRIDKTQKKPQQKSEGRSIDTDEMGLEVSAVSKLERRRRIEDLNEEKRLRQEMSVF